MKGSTPFPCHIKRPSFYKHFVPQGACLLPGALPLVRTTLIVSEYLVQPVNTNTRSQTSIVATNVG